MGRKRQTLFTIRLLAKKQLISGDVLNPESEGSAQSHNNCFQKDFDFKVLMTFEQKVPQSLYASQNDHKRKGFHLKLFAKVGQKQL